MAREKATQTAIPDMAPSIDQVSSEKPTNEVQESPNPSRKRDEALAVKARRSSQWEKIFQDHTWPAHGYLSSVGYVDTCPQLFSTAAHGCPHLVDVESLDWANSDGLTVADMVITVLYHHSPETLARFLDTTHEFCFRSRSQRQPGSINFLIVRTREGVTCGYEKDKKWIEKHVFFLVDSPLGLWAPMEIWRNEKGKMVLQATAKDYGNDDFDLNEVMERGSNFALRALMAREWEVEEEGRTHVRDTCMWRN